MHTFVSAKELWASCGEFLETTADGRSARVVYGHHGWFLSGPYVSVKSGLYRVKAHARAEGAPDCGSYFDVFELFLNRIYAAHIFRADPEVYVWLHATDKLEFRFRTHGELLRVYGVEIESLLLDEEAATSDQLEALLKRLVDDDAEPNAIFHAADRLAASGAPDAAAALRDAYLAQRTNRNAEPEVWRRLLALHGRAADLSPDLGAAPALPEEPVRAYVAHQHLTIINVTNSTPESRKDVRARGYQLHHLVSTRLYRESSPELRQWTYPDGSEILQPLFERSSEIDRRYEASLASGLGFPAFCPVTGEFLRSSYGFLVQYAQMPYIFYRFEGAETFYICCGENSDARLFAYMPRSQTIAWFAEATIEPARCEGVVRAFNVLLALFTAEAARYLAQPTRPAAVCGNFNYGHYFWVDISGLHFAVESGLADKLAGVVKAPQQFGKPEEIFPELSHLPIHDCANQKEAFRVCLKQGYLPIHFTDITVREPLARRLRALAREKASPAGRPPPKIARPLLWLNLRAHNKVWTSQVEGYAEILGALANDYGQVSALLDGTPDCREIAEGIRARCGPAVALYDGLEFSLYDKMNWAMEADGYICVIGTGLVICHSLAGARGVAHGNREHMTQLRWWPSIQIGSPTPLAPRMEDIHDSGTELQRDYDVDWRVLLELIRGHLRDRFVPRSRPAAPGWRRRGEALGRALGRGVTPE